jgi:hypothetical protein
MFERDWGRACAKEKFMSMLARENRACAAGKSDKAALAEVHGVLKKHYQVRVVLSAGAGVGMTGAVAGVLAGTDTGQQRLRPVPAAFGGSWMVCYGSHACHPATPPVRHFRHSYRHLPTMRR